MNICKPPSATHDAFGARRRALDDDSSPPRIPAFGRTLVRLWDARRKAASQRLTQAERHACRALDDLQRAQTVSARLRASAAVREREWIGGDTYREMRGRRVQHALETRAHVSASIASKEQDVRAHARQSDEARANIEKARQQNLSIGRRHQKLERWLQRLEMDNHP